MIKNRLHFLDIIIFEILLPWARQSEAHVVTENESSERRVRLRWNTYKNAAKILMLEIQTSDFFNLETFWKRSLFAGKLSPDAAKKRVTFKQIWQMRCKPSETSIERIFLLFFVKSQNLKLLN